MENVTCNNLLKSQFVVVQHWCLYDIFLFHTLTVINKNIFLHMQELLELAQRKFLRQVSNYAEESDEVYPRLLLLDFVSMVKESG